MSSRLESFLATKFLTPINIFVPVITGLVIHQEENKNTISSYICRGLGIVFDSFVLEWTSSKFKGLKKILPLLGYIGINVAIWEYRKISRNKRLRRREAAHAINENELILEYARNINAENVHEYIDEDADIEGEQKDQPVDRIVGNNMQIFHGDQNIQIGAPVQIIRNEVIDYEN